MQGPIDQIRKRHRLKYLFQTLWHNSMKASYKNDCRRILLRAFIQVIKHFGNVCHSHILGKSDWGVRYVIIFLYVQFWIRLAAVSYRGKKVRTVASPAVRSVHTSRDTRNRVQNEPEYAICVIFTTRLYYKALGIILCAMIWQIRHNYNRLDDFHCDVTGHRKISALGTAGAMVTTHENSVMMVSFKGPKFTGDPLHSPYTPSGLSNDRNLGLRPRFLSTESLGPCFSHGMRDHD